MGAGDQSLKKAITVNSGTLREQQPLFQNLLYTGIMSIKFIVFPGFIQE
jgi:hypothetical protein